MQRRSYGVLPRIFPIICSIFFLGWFENGQQGALILGAPDFNNAGGGLLFNHPGAPAIDGMRFYLPDKHNNRILVWKTLPQGNVEPDFVLGQKDFTGNAPGEGRDELNWPVSVAAGKGIVAVADTYNDRILLWLSEPEHSFQAADIQLSFSMATGGPQPGPQPGTEPGPGDESHRMEWPWAVWTDGDRLIATATGGSQAIFIWQSIPQRDDQPPDLVLFGKSETGSLDFGTPRTILSDGKTFLAIGDHNAKNQQAEQGTFVWHTFPTQPDEPYTHFMTEGSFNHGLLWGGRVLPGKAKIGLGTRLYIWPTDGGMTTESLALSVGRASGPTDNAACEGHGFPFHSGDGSGWAMSEAGQIFVSLANANRVVVFNSLPTSAEQCPDYAIGSPDIDTNTLKTHHMITNAIVASDGESLFAFSDFDRTFSIWRELPEQSGTYPDASISLEFPPWDAAISGDVLLASGHDTLAIWDGLPRDGRLPDQIIRQQLDGISFGELAGVAYQDGLLFLSDGRNKRLSYFSRQATGDFKYLGSFDIERAGRISADEDYLATVSYDPNEVRIYRIDDLKAGKVTPLAVIGQRTPSPDEWSLELPQNVLLAEGHLFVADTNRNRVLGWQSVEDAIVGVEPDLVLGSDKLTAGKKTNFDPSRRLFMPAGLAYANGRLWVGGFKFSNYMVAFDDPSFSTTSEIPSPLITETSGCGCATTDPFSTHSPSLSYLPGLFVIGLLISFRRGARTRQSGK